MIRKLLAGAAAAALLGLAAPACAKTPPPLFNVMDTYKAELNAGKMTPAEYQHLQTMYEQGWDAIADSVVRGVRRGPLGDQFATQQAKQAAQDFIAAVEAKDATAMVDAWVNGSQGVALTFGEPMSTMATQVCEQYLSVQEQLIVARADMPDADPAIAPTLQHKLDIVNEEVASELNQFKVAMQSWASIDPTQATPAQRQAAINAIQTFFDKPPPQPPADGQPNDGSSPGDQTPTPYTPDCRNGDCSATSDTGSSSADTGPSAPHPDHTAANAARRPGVTGDDPTGQSDTSFNASRNTNGVPPPPPSAPPVVQTQAPRLPTQPPRPPQLDPVKVVVVQHNGDMGDVKFGSDDKGGRVPVEYDAPDGSKTFYRQDANGRTVPAMFVDASGHSWGYDAKGDPSIDLGGPGGGGGANGGSGGATGGGSSPVRANTQQPLKAQFPPPDTTGYPSFVGLTSGGTYVLATVKPIYNGWTYGPANAGSIMMVPSNQIAGPSKAGGGGPVINIFGPSSVMTSLSLDTLSGLTLTSGLRVGTPVGTNWTIPYQHVPSFDDLCGR